MLYISVLFFLSVATIISGQTCAVEQLCFNQFERYCPSLANDTAQLKYNKSTGKQIIDLQAFLAKQPAEITQYAAQLANQDPNILPNHELVVTWTNTRCSKASVREAILVFENQPTLAGKLIFYLSFFLFLLLKPSRCDW